MMFDPSASDTLYFSEGIGVWRTTPPTNGNTSLTWTSQTLGIEQLVSNSIIAPVGNHPFYTAWDRPVFSITDPDVYPSTHGPSNTYSIIAGWDSDYASNDPTYVVADMDWGSNELSGYSTDGGQTWSQFPSDPAESLLGGAIAAASSTDLVWAPEDNVNPYYTLDGGHTWTQVNAPGVPTSGTTGWGFAYYLDNHMVAADRVNIGTFYMFNYIYGLYRSTDGGITWSEIASSTTLGGGTGVFLGFNQELEAVPGEAGNLFFTGGPAGGHGDAQPAGEAFERSTDGGVTWTAVPNVKEVWTFGFGAPKTPGGYPSIYLVGWYNNVYGIWQSTDDANSWTQVGQWPLNSIDGIKTISGDMNTYGRIYVGFDGSGSAYGDTSDAAPSVWVTTPTENQTVAGSVGLTATHNGEVPVSSVQFEVDGSKIGSAITSAPYTATWNSTGAADGTHTLQAVALGTNGEYATSSVRVSVQNSAPVISSIASAVGATGATSTITWTTNNSATSEVVYGPTTSYGLASSSTSLVTSHSIALSALSVSTTYHYEVIAADALGNTATSSDQTFTTPGADATPPSTPTNLVATASSSVPDEIDLSWTASTGNGIDPLDGYQIFRDRSQVGTTSATTYADIGLTAGTTYTYWVSAYDSANNVSASSTSATATTTQGATWTLTASPPIQNLNFSAATATFSGVNIGTLSSNRVVVVGVFTGQPNSTTTSVTINGVSALLGGTVPNGRSTVWYAIISSSTVANVVTTEPLAYATVGIEVGVLTGVTATPISIGTHSAIQGDPQSIGTTTVPTDGVGVIFGGVANISTSSPPTPAWAGAIGDSYISDLVDAVQVFVAHTYAAGSQAPSLSGGYSFKAPQIVMATWGSSVAVSLTAPTASTTLDGPAVTLSATSTGSVTISNVQFEVDGADIGSPYQFASVYHHLE